MKASLEAKFNDLTSLNNDAAEFAFDQSKASYELTRDRFKALDAKAVALTGVITTGLGAIAVLGDPAKIPAHGLWLYLALAALSFALVASLYSLTPRGIANPDLSHYVWPKTLSNVDNLARIQTALARDWLRDAATVERANADKAIRLKFATVLLVAGLTGLILNYLQASPGEKPYPTVNVIVTSPAPISTPSPSSSLSN